MTNLLSDVRRLIEWSEQTPLKWMKLKIEFDILQSKGAGYKTPLFDVV